MIGPSDYELLDAWRDGDRDAGNQIVRRHFRSVYRFFRSKLDVGVEDLTQRTFLAAVEGRDQFRGEAPFVAYLLAIARRQLLLQFRKQHRARKLFDFTDVSIQQLGREQGPSPSNVLAQHDEQRILLAALRRIPIDFQITVELFYWEELPIADIATVLEVKVGTIKSRLARARDMLKRAIAELTDDEHLLQTTLDNLERWASSLRGVVGQDDEGPQKT